MLWQVFQDPNSAWEPTLGGQLQTARPPRLDAQTCHWGHCGPTEPRSGWVSQATTLPLDQDSETDCRLCPSLAFSLLSLVRVMGTALVTGCSWLFYSLGSGGGPRSCGRDTGPQSWQRPPSSVRRKCSPCIVQPGAVGGPPISEPSAVPAGGETAPTVQTAPPPAVSSPCGPSGGCAVAVPQVGRVGERRGGEGQAPYERAGTVGALLSALC